MEKISQNNSKKINILEQSGHPNYFRRDVHELLSFGYTKVRPTINADTEEPTITARLAEAIDKGFNTIGILPERLAKKPYSIKAETVEIETKDLKNIKDKHIFYDIVFEEVGQTIPRRRYTFEGKRLKKNKFSIGLYCADGISRFVEEIYASDCPEAAMIGFYQDADVNYWFKELTRKFKENEQDNKMQLIENLTKKLVISDFSNEWVSLHQRKSKGRIILFHIFLECL